MSGGDITALLSSSVEWLRPLVNNKQWDYCVIWKLGNDPSKFIEWGAACCSGGNRVENIAEIKDENGVVNVECKDRLNKHFVTSKACKALAKLPSFIPLYSGIHGDVVISKQPRWVNHGNGSESNDNQGQNGTQVLIPVACGLIELFCTQKVPIDQKIIDYISSRFKLISPNQETMSENTRQLYDPYSSNIHPETWMPYSFEGSSTGSSLSNEHQSMKLGYNHVLEKSSLVAPPRTNLKLKKNNMSTNSELKEVSMKINRQKGEKGIYKSKNLMTERNRRQRIKDGMFSLRALVPKISKMDRASTLGDAAEYIEELKGIIQSYEDELKTMEEQDHLPKATRDYSKKKGQFGASKKTPVEVQVEVNQLGTKDFLVKLVCKKNEGGFSTLMEAMNSLGFQVIDANITTFNDSVLNILKVEANKTGIEPKILKYSLSKLVKSENQ